MDSDEKHKKLRIDVRENMLKGWCALLLQCGIVPLMLVDLLRLSLVKETEFSQRISQWTRREGM